MVSTIVKLLEEDDEDQSATVNQTAKRIRNKSIKKQLLKSSKSVCQNVSSESEVEQSSSLLRSIAAKPAEISEEMQEELMETTKKMLENIKTNDLPVSATVAKDILESTTNVMLATKVTENGTVSTEDSASEANKLTTEEKTRRANLAKQYTKTLSDVTTSLAKSLVPGESTTISTGDVELVTEKQYTDSMKSAPTTFTINTTSSGSSNKPSPSFTVDPNVFSTSNFTGVEILTTEFYKMKVNIFSFAEKNTTKTSSPESEIVVLSFKKDDGSEIKVNGSAPIDITIPIKEDTTATIPTSSPTAAPTAPGKKAVNYTRKCRYFDESRDEWSTGGCTVKETHSTHTVCTCTHLTAFSSADQETESEDSQESAAESSGEAAGKKAVKLLIVFIVIAVVGGLFVGGAAAWKYMTGSRAQVGAMVPENSDVELSPVGRPGEQPTV
eukprot:jgi/Bigna1/128200/aug1.6_g2908